MTSPNHKKPRKPGSGSNMVKLWQDPAFREKMKKKQAFWRENSYSNRY